MHTVTEITQHQQQQALAEVRLVQFYMARSGPLNRWTLSSIIQILELLFEFEAIIMAVLLIFYGLLFNPCSKIEILRYMITI